MSSASVLRCESAGETFGEVLRVREVPGFLLRESRYAGGVDLPRHRHPGCYFAYAAAGGILERTPGGERHHEAGSLHFHPVDEPHSARIDAAGLTTLSIIPVRAHAARLEGARAPSESTGPARFAGLAARCRRELRATDSASDLALEALALELVAAWIRAAAPRRPGPRWLDETRDFLHDHRDRPVRLAELAGLVGVHEVYLVRAFRRRFGFTPGDYQRRLRVEAAQRRLVAEPGTPLVEVALGAGFANQAHFGRVFRALTGESPGAYRRARSTRPS